MSPILARPGSARPSTHGDMLSMVELAARYSAEAYSRWFTITNHSLGREFERLVQGVKTSTPPVQLLRGISNGYVNWLREVAALGPSVAEEAAMEFSRRLHVRPDSHDGHARPAAEGESFEVNGKPFPMPARVLDASQGWAMYFVGTEAANRSIEANDKGFSENFSAFDAGDGRTPP